MKNIYSVFLLSIILINCLLKIETHDFVSVNRNTTMSQSSSAVEKCLLTRGLRQPQIILRDRNSTRIIYNYLNYQWNIHYPVKMPMMYVLPDNDKHVQEVVYCSRINGIRAVPKSGGHSFAKYAYGDEESLVIDFQNFNSIVVNANSTTVTVDPGVRIGTLHSWLLERNIIFPIGRCSSVGIGMILGGGYSSLSRQYGMMMDPLLEVDIVTPSASLITANSVINKDLFWAVRGAGAGAAFGIVTRYKFKALPKPIKVVSRERLYPLEMLPEILTSFMAFTASAHLHSESVGMEIYSDHIFVFAHEAITEISNTTNSNVDAALSYFPQNNTLDILDFKDALKTKLEEVDSNELKDHLTHNGTNYFNENHPLDTWSIHKQKAFITDKILNANQIADLSSLIQNEIPETCFIDFLPFGGAISKLDPTDTAFVHRKPGSYKVAIHYSNIKLPIIANCTGSKSILETETCSTPIADPIAKSASLNFQRKLYNLTLDIFKHNEAYQNDVDDELEYYLERFFGQNLERLMEIKTRFDPDNYFHNPQSIPTIS